ncbi:MAG: D-alanine transaminase [Halanaerobiales bacterium]|nr:D-alanine transaminase [Halanaerobiales bacterium]
MNNPVYINGEFMEYEAARIDLEDRGYQFADGVYEVINSYNGKPFRMIEHFERLKKSAAALEIKVSDYGQLQADAEELIRRSGFTDASLYLQITRGTEPRSHAYSDDLTPNIVMTVKELKNHPDEYYQKGVKAITLPDERWSRCYIKTIALLPNVLAKKKAKRAGAFEAIMVRDGFITEGTSSNLFIVRDERIITPPATNYILNGITRRVILEEAAKLGFTVLEESISLGELFEADEVFLTGTTTEVMPVVEIDGGVIKDGKPGKITGKLFDHYRGLLG